MIHQREMLLVFSWQLSKFISNAIRQTHTYTHNFLFEIMDNKYSALLCNPFFFTQYMWNNLSYENYTHIIMIKTTQCFITSRVYKIVWNVSGFICKLLQGLQISKTLKLHVKYMYIFLERELISLLGCSEDSIVKEEERKSWDIGWYSCEETAWLISPTSSPPLCFQLSLF